MLLLPPHRSLGFIRASPFRESRVRRVLKEIEETKKKGYATINHEDHPLGRGVHVRPRRSTDRESTLRNMKGESNDRRFIGES